MFGHGAVFGGKTPDAELGHHIGAGQLQLAFVGLEHVAFARYFVQSARARAVADGIGAPEIIPGSDQKPRQQATPKNNSGDAAGFFLYFLHFYCHGEIVLSGEREKTVQRSDSGGKVGNFWVKFTPLTLKGGESRKIPENGVLIPKKSRKKMKSPMDDLENPSPSDKFA